MVWLIRRKILMAMRLLIHLIVPAHGAQQAPLVPMVPKGPLVPMVPKAPLEPLARQAQQVPLVPKA